MTIARPESRLGLGAWAFGRTGWGIQHDQDSAAAIIRAVENGIMWIDTAAIYGDGHSERLIGRTLTSLPEHARPRVFTKGGLRIDPSSGATLRDLRPDSLRHQCEASLDRLGVERIDLYQLHWPVEDSHVVERAWETVAELQQEGKIRWAGVSNFGVPLLEACARVHPIDAMQVPLSLLNRDSGRDLIPWAAEQGVGVLAYSPLESGLLSGGFSRRRLESLPSSDWRRERKQFQRPVVDRTFSLVERLRPLAAELGASLTELAIAWTLAWPAVDGVIVGARNARQVDGWVRAPSVTLDDVATGKITAALVETRAGEGPVAPTHCVDNQPSIPQLGRPGTTMANELRCSR
jgi:aryl-alcohol dehydrogenase-like predicted oxidoreductase